jgi:adenine-specific DNA-methyltransferase
MPVELVWDGKYDAEGRKCAPLRLILPFQTVETVNESVQERQRGLDALFSGSAASEWRNRLIWGDKKYVLPSLLPEFAGKVKLIYIDPPFATGDDFSFQVEIEGEEFTKEPSMIEQKAYRDTWGRGLDSYLQWFYETAVLLRELLTEDGSLFVHLDWHVGHYAKSILDEVFGSDNFINEIIWYYYNKLHDSRKKLLPRAHDVIFRYSKSVGRHVHTPLKEKRENPVKKLKYKKVGGQIQNIIGDDGKAVTYMSEERTIDDVWRIRCLQPANIEENVLFSTQKPVDLLERLITLGSLEDDIVLDCFGGSGTTAVAAQRLNRRWITCDLGRFAIHTARKRLLSIPNVEPFVVQNLGKYERQSWQEAEFGADAAARVAAYTRFILDLYRAQPLNGFAWLHGLKGGRVVHVGAVDSPVTLADVKAILIEWRKNLGKTGAANSGIDILGWEFALDMNETAKQQAADAGVDLRFLTIPREVLEDKAVKQGDIQFFELAALAVKETVQNRELTLTLDNFIAPREYVPQEIREKITRWDAWIDYWAIDFDFKGDTFHNQWQSYRTRKNKKLELTTKHTYDAPGSYTVQVKVIDILGNDTTRTMRVEIK